MIEIYYLLTNAVKDGIRKKGTLMWRPSNLKPSEFFKIELVQRGTDQTSDELDRLDIMKGYFTASAYKEGHGVPLLGRYNDGKGCLLNLN